jgi:hypothetical protein
VCLKALTSNQFLAELVAPPVACEPIWMNQMARMMLFAMMPMLDDVNITTVQRGDLSHSVAIPGTDVSSGLGGATCSRGCVVVSDRGGGPARGGLVGGRGSGT